jgi:hypothetical protein
MKIGPQQVSVGRFIRLSSSRIFQLLLKTRQAPTDTAKRQSTSLNHRTTY